MVAFSAWVDIVFEHVEVNLNIGIGGPGQAGLTGADVMQTAAAVWNDRTAELKNATRRQAESIAQEEIRP
jgi:hypothetical protein